MRVEWLQKQAFLSLLLWGLFPGTLNLGCWEESLPRIKGILIKTQSFLDTKVEPEWTLTSEYPNEIKAFNTKDRVLYLGAVTAKWLVHKRTWTISLFSRNICGLSSEKSGKDTYWLIKTERLGMLTRKGKRNTHWMIIFFCFLYIKD